MRNHRLLIVDDSNFIRSRIARSLGESGVEIVGPASNGAKAVASFDKLRPDVVTMDLTMPEMDGLECIRQLRRRDPRVRILVVSALADKSDAIQALKARAQGFLCKPFTGQELSDAIHDLLEEN